MENIREHLFQKMRDDHINMFYLGLSDDHQSEYVQEAFQNIKYLTGFSGSNAMVVAICRENERSIRLWTDGRYFIQAEKQLEGTGVILMKIATEGYPTPDEFIRENIRPSDTLVSCGSRIGAVMGRRLEEICRAAGAEFSLISDLEKYIPTGVEVETAPVRIYPMEYAGVSTRDKIDQVRQKLYEAGANALSIINLEEICWLFNIRGNDIPCNPVCLSYAVITPLSVRLYLNRNVISDQLRAYASEQGFEIAPYEDYYGDLRNFTDNSVWLFDPSDNNCLTEHSLKASQKMVEGVNPIPLLKAVKNETEIKWTIQRYIEDSAVLTKLILRLKNDPEFASHDEWYIADTLNKMRLEQKDCFDLSFLTISAWGENAAMMHYEPDEDHFSETGTDGFLLIDSGGQYMGATTDVTRTISRGHLTDEMIADYTDVTVSHLDLMQAVFLDGVNGMNLDILARGRLWKRGLDYKCGTGHGIGSCLSVHETPPGLSWQYRKGRDIPFKPGMIVSDEPGVYKEGKYGIRIESILLVEDCCETSDGRFFKFRPLTFVPLDNDAMDKSRMTEREIAWYNDYQMLVRNTIAPYLTEEENKQLIKETLPL